MFWLAWAFAFAIVGCGDNFVDESAVDRSGSQLRLRWFEYPDGARERVGWFDSRLGDPCRAIEWPDGIVRCTPGYWVDEFNYAIAVFANAGCTDVVGKGADNYFNSAKYVFLEDPPGVPSQLLRIGEARFDVAEFYVRDRGACTGPFPADGSSFHAIDAVIQTTELVALEPRILPSTGRLAHVVLEGSDGSSVWSQFHDTMLGFDCYRYDGVCWPDSAPTDATIDVELAPIDVVVEPVEGRRLADNVAVTGRLRAKAYGLFDTERETRCSVFQDPLAPDPRCVPILCCTAEEAFAEPTCQTPIRVARRADDEVDRYAYFVANGVGNYLAIRDPIDAFVLTPTGECVPFGVPPGYTAHALDSPLTREAFSPATFVID